MVVLPTEREIAFWCLGLVVAGVGFTLLLGWVKMAVIRHLEVGMATAGKKTVASKNSTANAVAQKNSRANIKDVKDKAVKEKFAAKTVELISPKRGRPLAYDVPAVKDHVIREMSSGRSLHTVCREDAGMPSPGTVMSWTLEDPDFSVAYMNAKSTALLVMAEEIAEISEETNAVTMVPRLDADGNPMYDAEGQPLMIKKVLPLNADVVARNRLRIDSRKWLLSKMMPKQFGDKTTTELTGVDGKPIEMTSTTNLKSLSMDELAQMEQMLLKLQPQEKK